MKAKIFYIADSQLPSERANSVNIAKMCEAFAQNGAKVELVIPSFQSDKVTDLELFEYYDIQRSFGLNVIKIPKIPGTLFLFAFRVAIWFLSNRKKLGMEYLIYGRSPLAIGLLAMLGFKVGIDLHGKTWKTDRLRYSTFKQIVKSKNTKLISFNSEQLKSVFSNDYKKFINKTLKLIALPNGSTEGGNNAHFEFQGEGGLRIGYLGSFLSGRGIDLIIRMSNEVPDAEFHLVGGPDKELKKLNDSSLPGNVYLYSHIPYKFTSTFRKGCDILVAPYQQNVSVPSGENTVQYMSPIKIFEYMSSGKAIICSDFPVLHNILNDENSILVEAGDLSQWVLAINSLRDEKRRKELGDKAYKDFLANYTWERRAEKVLGLTLHV